jgi:hypothetical protein
LKILFFISKTIKDYEHQNNEHQNNEYVKLHLPVKELLAFCGITRKSLIQTLRLLRETEISFTDEKSTSYVGIFSKVEDAYNGEIKIDVYYEVLEKIIKLKNKYTTIDIEHLHKIKNKHTLRMLMILENVFRYDNHTLSKKYFELDELNALFGTNYKRGLHFKQKVLDPVKEDLDLISKLSFVFDRKFDKVVDGKGRARVVGFTIFPVDNKNPQPSLF